MTQRLQSAYGKISDEELEAGLARSDFGFFCEYVHRGGYTSAAHTDLIARRLEEVERGEVERLLVLLPPRHSKSMSITETFPAWFIGRNPERRVILTAYGDSLARSFGRRNLHKLQEYAEPLFGLNLDAGESGASAVAIEGHRGGIVSAGIGGPLTGHGADCLPAGTMITTDSGVVDIEEISRTEDPPLVLSYDHHEDRLVYRRVIASRERWSDEIIEIETVAGRKVRSTAEHRYYIHESGYREAELLRPGDRLVVKGDVSPESPPVEVDTISKVRRVRGPSIPVYDLQIEGTSNFFANEILVHNCLIIDDPVKNRREADSQTYRDMVWDEWQNTLSTRLQPGGVVVTVLTRWHEDDLAGRLLEREKGKWDMLRLPALAEEDDQLGRKPGEPLWPEFGFDEEWATNKKATVGSYVWSSLYQQSPSPSGGGILRRDWWQYYDHPPHKFDEVIQSWDMAFKDTKASSYVVGQIWGRKGADKYLLDQVREQLDFVATIRALKNLTAKWPQARRKLVEDKANGPAVISTLKRTISGLVPVTPQGSKEARVHSVSPDIEAGNVHIPENTPWIGDFIQECSAFPNAAHDDQVDAMSQALERLGMHGRRRARTFGRDRA